MAVRRTSITHRTFGLLRRLERNRWGPLHLGYKDTEPWPLEEIWSGNRRDYTVQKIRFPKKWERGSIDRMLEENGHNRYIVELIGRVVRVSVESYGIAGGLSAIRFSN